MHKFKYNKITLVYSFCERIKLYKLNYAHILQIILHILYAFVLPRL